MNTPARNLRRLITIVEVYPDLISQAALGWLYLMENEVEQIVTPRLGPLLERIMARLDRFQLMELMREVSPPDFQRHNWNANRLLVKALIRKLMYHLRRLPAI